MNPPDLHSNPEALLAHAEWIRALARRLVTDESLADDVVQEAWLAMLRHPLRGVRDPAGWIAGVVRNLARRAQRSRIRGEARELRADPPPPPPSPSEILEQEAARKQVVDAVLALDEPYRSTLLLRYYEELEPIEIARRLAIPPGTVRTRLRRALSLLRERLVGNHGPRSLPAGLVLLAGWSPPTTHLGPVTAITTGGLLMSGKLVLAMSALAVVASLTAVGYWISEHESEPTGGTELISELQPGIGEQRSSGPDRPELSAKVEVPRLPVGVDLRVRRFDDAPAAAARVVLFRGESVLASLLSDSRGVVQLPPAHKEAELAIRATDAPLLRKRFSEVKSGLEVRLGKGTAVSGLVLVDGERPGEMLPLMLAPDAGWVEQAFLPPAVWVALETSYDATYTTTASGSGFFRFAGLPEEWRGAGICTPHGLFARFEQTIEDRGTGEPERYRTPVSGPNFHVSLECFREVTLKLRVVHSDGTVPRRGFRFNLRINSLDGGTEHVFSPREVVEMKLKPHQIRSPLEGQAYTHTFAGVAIRTLVPTGFDSEGLCDLGVLHLAPLERIVFTVRDENGRPVGDAHVRQYSQHHTWHSIVSYPTNSGGMTALDYDVRFGQPRVEGPGFRIQKVQVGTPPQKHIEVQLQRATTLLISLTAAEEARFDKTRIEIATMTPLFPHARGWVPEKYNILQGSRYNLMFEEREEGGVFQIHPSMEGRLQLADLLANIPMHIRVLGEADEVLSEVDVPALWDGENRVVGIHLPVR